MKIILAILIFTINSLNGQYYQNNNEDIEQKNVNSGQSLTLICDLPNIMPDGRVSVATTFHFLFASFIINLTFYLKHTQFHG